jgi:hypothetical protein
MNEEEDADAPVESPEDPTLGEEEEEEEEGQYIKTTATLTKLEAVDDVTQVEGNASEVNPDDIPTAV